MSSSSAAVIQFEPDGRQGIGVAQPQSGLDYPLVGVPSSDIRYLLADAYLSYDDPATYDKSRRAWQLPFRIYWLYGVGTEAAAKPAEVPDPTHEADVLIVDANKCVVFDSTQAGKFISKPWGDRLHVYGWESADAVCVLTVHTAWSEQADPHLEPVLYAEHIVPTSADLDPRTTARRPARVKSLKVVLDQFAGVAVDFRGGYNMDITHRGPLTRGRRRVHQVLFDATPGNGLGVFPNCGPENTVLRRINGTGPDTAGDFFFGAQGCYYARQPTELTTSSPREYTVTPNTLHIGNDCDPCCDCEDYVAVAEFMNEVRDRWFAVGQLAENTRDLYHDSRQRWLDASCCFAQFPIRLFMQAQICPTMDIAGQFCNNTAQCVGPVRLDFNVSLVGNPLCAGNPITATVMPGFTAAKGQSLGTRRGGREERYTLGGTWPNFYAVWDSVDPFQSVWVRFRLSFGCCGVNNDGQALVPSVTLSGTVAGQAITSPNCSGGGQTVSTATRSLPLRCPLRAEDTFNLSCS